MQVTNFFSFLFLRDRATLILNSERLKLNEYATTIDGSQIVSSLSFSDFFFYTSFYVYLS